MQSPFIAAINQLCAEKNLPREVVYETVKAALRAAYRKDYGNRDQNVEVELSEQSGLITVFLVKDVVVKVEDPQLQMSVKEAKGYKPDIKAGEQIRIDVTPAGYGRIAAQSAKQVIIQRLQEAERDMMYQAFKDRENELLNALVHRVENSQVYINLDKITTVLLSEYQIPGERYFAGQRLKIYLDRVIKTTKGPQLLISRTHPSLVKKLLELEIPEIKAGIVVVKAVARKPGVRCKVAVVSSDQKVDPIGACVGQKGVRIQNIMEELNGERIDIIHWKPEPDKFIEAALSPAKIIHIDVNEQAKRASIYVNPDQRPLAIGKQGQNVSLASHLTGYELDIKDVADLSEDVLKNKGVKAKPVEKVIITEVDKLDLPAAVIEKLKSVNLSQVEQLKGLGAKDFASIEGITQEDGEKIVDAVKHAG